MNDDNLKQNRVKYAIEDSFPIVEINRLAIPERNAFKPIYQMHKWFARRASCVFRAILLGCMKPLPLDEKGNPLKSGAEVIMEEFYKDHTNDPDTNGKVVLDPFMGGGTTVVEALRLGCKVIGIDLNPVAWFIVKTEVEPVDINELKASFERLAERKVEWSGKSVKETLLDQYKTECPCCGAGREDADIIYTFWVKSAICTNPLCKKQVPLFSDYIIAAKSPSIKYNRDVECPECGKTFDWEREPASLVAEPTLCKVSPSYSAGIGRTSARWSFSSMDSVECPWCKEIVKAISRQSKAERKKIPLSVLLCPHCYAVWQWRGNLPEEVDCPVCKKSYNTQTGNVPKSGWFLCPACGHTDRIINSIRSLPEEQLLPMRPYAIEGYCGSCAGDNEDEIENGQITIDGKYQKLRSKRNIDHNCLIIKNNGKFFKNTNPSDIEKYQKACEVWEKEKKILPYPGQKIPWGEKTKSGLIAHHYNYWHQMFNPRQLLCLSTLLKAIDEEEKQILKEMLLNCFSNCLNDNNMFCRFAQPRNHLVGVFARHDFQPKIDPLEGNVWGSKFGHGQFSNYWSNVIRAKEYGFEIFNFDINNTIFGNNNSQNKFAYKNNVNLYAKTSTKLNLNNSLINFIITDPPYAGNVNYSELADLFYVWIRIVLSKMYKEFAPDLSPKVEEVIENPTRGKSSQDFEEGLSEVFYESRKTLDNDGILSFTFHHSGGQTWEHLLQAVINSGFVIKCVYPIHGESEISLHLMNKESISYDLIHVCHKKLENEDVKSRSWAGIRQEIRRRARDEIKAIEAGRYGNESISPVDVNIILIGKCLELYSMHCGAIIDHEGKNVPLHDALEEIRMMVDQLVTKEQQIPSDLADIDPESYIYLSSLCGHKEIKGDDVHKATRGILEPDSLFKAGIMIKGRSGRGRTYEVKQPNERFGDLLEKFKINQDPQQNLFADVDMPKPRKGVYFIDYIHFLMALIDGKQNVIPWLDHFRHETPRIRAACEYLMMKNKSFAPSLKKILDLIDVGPLFQQR